MNNQQPQKAVLKTLGPAQQVVIARSYQEDTVEGIYEIHLSEPVIELSNEFCHYYQATNLENNQQCFALVFEKQFSPSLDIWDKLRANPVKGLNNLLAYSLVRLSLFKAEYLVAIVEHYDFSNNLVSLIQQNGPLPPEVVKNQLINWLAQILQQLEKLNLSCGNINAANIIAVGEGGQFLLREFINAYPGFYQLDSYLAPEIAECVELGRATQGSAADIYALGMTAFYALTGKPADDYQPAVKFNQQRFAQTTYKVLISQSKFSERFKLFFKWATHDDLNLRWQTSNIFAWITGYISSNATFETILENTNLLAFNGQSYDRLKSIAYSFYCHWEEAALFIYDDKLIKWATRSQISDEIITNMALATAEKILPTDLSDWHNVSSANKLTQLLLAIDPRGSIRQKGLAVTARSVPNALHYYLVKSQKLASEQLVKILLMKYWHIGSNGAASAIDVNLAQSFTSVVKIFSAGSATCGIERVMYALNPAAACLSPLLAEWYVTNLSELLAALETMAEHYNLSSFVIDRHIIAFIAAKIDLAPEQDIKLLPAFPKLSNNPLIFGLSILNIAQQNQPKFKIPHLSKMLTTKIIALLDRSLHNVNFKQQISSQLTAASESDNLSLIVNILNDQTAFMNDYNGYYNACKKVASINNYINSVNAGDGLNEVLFFGQKMTVLASYIFCFFVTLVLIV